MELQPGLALPVTHHNPPPANGFDLNTIGFEPKETMGFGVWNYGGCLNEKKYVNNKRGFDEAFGKIRDDESQTVPLLVWSGQPNEEDDCKGQRKSFSSTIYKNDEEGNHQIVGWPPIKSWRKKLFFSDQNQGGMRISNNRMAANENGGSNSIYVKVKMEGVAIVRKIDLRLFHCYQTLTNSLINLFIKDQKCDNDIANYTLTYQDKEGDWLLAGDDPWQTFIESVQRLEILRNGG